MTRNYANDSPNNTIATKRIPDHRVIFLSALALRLLVVGFTTLTTKNPYSLYDVRKFSARAQHAALGLTSGEIRVSSITNVTEVWGFMLSPFWLLPGPSRIYARLGMALLGSIAVYNVYIIARHYHSRRAGTFTIFPFLCYPSFLFIHSTVLREAVVLFGLTTVARLLLAPSPNVPKAVRNTIIGTSLLAAAAVRLDNIPVYGLVLLTALLLHHRTIFKNIVVRVVVIVSGIVIGIQTHPYISQRLNKIAEIRRARARGRTEYLGHVFPNAILEAMIFTWIGAAYFLFTPFPWMVHSVADFVVMFEGLGNLLYAAFAIVGTRRLARETVPGAGALFVGIVVGSVLYGLGTANVGTAVRHRQMVLWAIFLLGGIGMAEYIRIKGQQ